MDHHPTTKQNDATIINTESRRRNDNKNETTKDANNEAKQQTTTVNVSKIAEEPNTKAKQQTNHHINSTKRYESETLNAKMKPPTIPRTQQQSNNK